MELLRRLICDNISRLFWQYSLHSSVSIWILCFRDLIVRSFLYIFMCHVINNSLSMTPRVTFNTFSELFRYFL
jgi:hypothetical protein